MASYAALISLINTIVMEQRPRYHPHREICVDDRGLIHDLLERVDLLVGFLEESGWKGVGKRLERRIADAAYAAEDAIDTYMADQVQSGGTSPGNEGSAQLCQDLRKIIQDMDSILNDSRSGADSSSGSSAPAQGNRGEIKYHHLPDSSTTAGSTGAHSHHKQSQMMGFEIEDEEKDGGSSGSAGSSSSAPTHGEKSTMMGFEDERRKVVQELGHPDSNLKVISIVGMGGAGKTTLVRNIFEDQHVMRDFDVHVWVTISQEYNVQEILLRILSYINGKVNDTFEDEALALEVYQSLFGRKYFVILDDIWSIDVWHEIKKSFPDDLCDGSRIVITTRDVDVATQMSTYCIEMKYLDEDKSWKLLREKAFGQTRTCPLELEDVGKHIAQNCKGLPLAIVVIGGLLAMSMEIEHWERIDELSYHAIRLDKEDHCLKILSLSYNYLPIYLKPCFLYMGIFPEDHKISVSRLINLWIAEGFLKPFIGKTIRETAKEYLKVLIARNLIMIHHWDSSGEIEYCSIHDLLRELSLEKALEEKFLCVVTLHRHLDLPSMMQQRRVAIFPSMAKIEEGPQKINSLLSTSNPRSLIVNNYEELSRLLGNRIFRLLKVCFVIGGYHKSKTVDHDCMSKVLFNLVNLRYISCEDDEEFRYMLVSSLGLLGNLQTLAVKNKHSTEAPSEIWNLPQLCHVEFDMISLPDPPYGIEEQHDYIVLQRLHTLQRLINFRFKDGVLTKIPNIKSLNICYNAKFLENMKWSQYSLHNIGCLKNLESFDCSFEHFAPDRNELLRSLVFPNSLKKLKLSGCGLLWEDMTVISSIPLLEVLELERGAFIGPEWNVSGQFLHLKYLCMKHDSGLIDWNIVESSQFPLLERLVLSHFPKLEEIPSEIGDIATLSLIKLVCCTDSAVISATKILIAQEELGNEELRVRVKLCRENKLSRSDLAGTNLQVQTEYKKSRSEDVEEGTAEEKTETETKNVSSGGKSSRPAGESSKQKISDTEYLPLLRSGAWADIGPRLSMEDAYVCADDVMKDYGYLNAPSESPCAFYGVFDGHRGKHAADFACYHLPRFILKDEAFSQDIERVIASAFVQTDTAFQEACSLDADLASGTTALAAVIRGSSLVVANAGDSRAVLCRRGTAIEMSRDHRPDFLEEKRRIEASGGFVEDGYLNGVLSISRALGDWEIEGLKGPDGGPLTAEPEIMSTRLTEEDEFLILGSDGLWDVFSSQNAVDFARISLQVFNDPVMCSNYLVNEALNRNSTDNLTVVVVCFQSQLIASRPRVYRSLSAEGLKNLQTFADAIDKLRW